MGHLDHHAQPGDQRSPSEINLQLKRWTIPKERIKLEKDHIVPLSGAAIELYKRLPSIDGCDLLFPAPGGGELSNAALCAVIDDMHEADLRGINGRLSAEKLDIVVKYQRRALTGEPRDNHNGYQSYREARSLLLELGAYQGARCR